MAKRNSSSRQPSRSDLPRGAVRVRSEGLLVVMTLAVFGMLAQQSAQSVEAASATIGSVTSATAFAAFAGVLGFTALNALFVASETALEVLRPIHIKHVKEKSPVDAEELQQLIAGRAKYVAATNIGSHTSRVALVLVSFLLAPALALAVAERFGWHATYLTLIGATVLILVPVGVFNLILGELVPRTYALHHPHRVALALRRFVRTASVVFAAPAALATSVASLVTTRFGARASFAIANQAEEEIKTLVESAQESGEIHVDEKEMLHSVFQFADTVAREVMTPRVDLDAVSIHSDLEGIVEIVRESGHSRIPIFEDTDDQILGIVHAKDLLMAFGGERPFNLRELMRPALYVPENKNLHQLLAEMRASRSQMAIVQDEQGGTAGIVTIEDIVEELVGDIVDEYDEEEEEILTLPDGFLVYGKTHLDDLNDEIGSAFDSDVFDTVGGYVFGLFGRQALPDESIEDDGYRFTVQETDGRRIHRLKIEAMDPAVSVSEGEAK